MSVPKVDIGVFALIVANCTNVNYRIESTDPLLRTSYRTTRETLVPLPSIRYHVLPQGHSGHSPRQTLYCPSKVFSFV